jgi:hypothetical protein
VIPIFRALLASSERSIRPVSSGLGTNVPAVLGASAPRDSPLVRAGTARQTSSPTHAADSPARTTKISQLQLDVSRFTATATAMLTEMMAAAVVACFRVDLTLTPRRDKGSISALLPST